MTGSSKKAHLPHPVGLELVDWVQAEGIKQARMWLGEPGEPHPHGDQAIQIAIVVLASTATRMSELGVEPTFPQVEQSTTT